ncbi:MAG: thiamine-phosphate diphosphorylase [Planctomycetes bacterium RBG_16_43_13]|nr:MAG: thiamine-phosphate diphosphorylase [Planctomycetes bacterium RBG_16_43_13]
MHLYVLLTKGIATKPLDYVAREAVRGGADVVQLRGEGMSDREFMATAKNIRAITEKRGIPFIVNNRVDIAKAVGADGVHLGKSDMPIEKARKILGIEKIIGATTHNISEVRSAVKSGADYISVGPMFTSTLKPSLQPMGFSYIDSVKKLGVPFFCIGGITSDNVRKVRKAGCRRIAVCHSVIGQKDIRGEAKRLKRIF